MVLSLSSVSASRALLQRHLRRIALATATVFAAAAIAACGGSSTSATASSLLAETFGANIAKIHSGELSLTLRAKLDGLAALHGKPVAVTLSGPFTSSSAGEEFDLSAVVNLGTTALPVGLISTGKALYVEVLGTYYALPGSVSSSLSKSASGAGASANILTKLHINPRAWLTEARIVGTKSVGGAETDHLTAQVEVRQLLGDIGKLAASGAGAVGSSAVTKQLNPANLDQFASAIDSAQVDIYTGASDHIMREFGAAIKFTVPPAGQSTLGGITGGSLALDVTISNLNAPETITAPPSSEPFKNLLGSLGGLSSL